jgi:hypothetical protein
MRNYFTQEALSESSLRNVFIAPIVGALFLMFLPLIGWYLVAKMLVDKTVELAKIPFVEPQQAVGAAYLTGSEGTAKLSDRSDEELSKLAEEIAKKRLDGQK